MMIFNLWVNITLKGEGILATRLKFHSEILFLQMPLCYCQRKFFLQDMKMKELEGILKSLNIKKDDLQNSFVSSVDIFMNRHQTELHLKFKDIYNNAIVLSRSIVIGTNERTLLEILAMMVQPSRLMKGRFHVSVFPLKYSVRNLLIKCVHVHLVDSLFSLQCFLIWQSISFIIYFFGFSEKNCVYSIQDFFYVYLLSNITTSMFLCLEFWLFLAVSMNPLSNCTKKDHFSYA